MATMQCDNQTKYLFGRFKNVSRPFKHCKSLLNDESRQASVYISTIY